MTAAGHRPKHGDDVGLAIWAGIGSSFWPLCRLWCRPRVGAEEGPKDASMSGAGLVSVSSASSIAERQASLPEGIAEHLHRIRPHAMQSHDLGLLDLGEMLKPGVAGPDQRPPRRDGQLGQVRLFSPYATVVRDRDRAGLPIDGFDAQIASICRTHGAGLATRNNSKDFRDTGVGVIDPWQPDPHAPTDPDP